MPSSTSDPMLTVAAEEGGLLYYDMIADCDNPPPRRSPLQFVKMDRRAAVIQRIFSMAYSEEGEMAYARGRDLYRNAVFDGVDRSKTLSRLSEKCQLALVDALTSRDLVYEEVCTHEPHPCTDKNRPASLYEMIVAINLERGGETVLASWITANIVSALEAAAVVAACREVMVSVLDDGLLLPNKEESEDVSDTSKTFRPSQSAPTLRERTFIPRTSDNDHKKRSSRTRPTCPLPARAQNVNTRSIDSVVPVPVAVHSIVEASSSSSGQCPAVSAEVTVAPLSTPASLEPRTNPILFFLASILGFLRLLVGW
ncbi:hypothetical protein EV714DRAFT_268392 [Schizophyllum commune]